VNVRDGGAGDQSHKALPAQASYYDLERGVIMDEIDKDALTRALELTRAEPDSAEQIESMLKDRPWEEVAQFAAYYQQCKNLRLKPSEMPPCHGAVNISIPGSASDLRFPAANQLLQRMLDAGLSQWEPDPEAALGPED
jgi:hypothetical protein